MVIYIFLLRPFVLIWYYLNAVIRDDAQRFTLVIGCQFFVVLNCGSGVLSSVLCVMTLSVLLFLFEFLQKSG